MKTMSILVFVNVVFCGLVLTIDAEKINQPRLYLENNNLHFEIPSQKYVKFLTNRIMINSFDLMPTLEQAKNSTKLLKNYELFISQFHSKMEDMENKIIDFGTGVATLNSINATAGSNLMNNVQKLSRRVLALERNFRSFRRTLTTNKCSSNPCNNGGTCLDLFNGFWCQCQNGWEGVTCQTDINECARFVGTDLGCQNGGTCINLAGTYQCQCQKGWIGLHCNRKPSDCNSGGSEICGHGTCVPQNNEAGYKCLCDAGWTTDGTHLTCSSDVDECKQNHPPCSTSPLVQCINVPGSFTCQPCPAGYTGNGYYCADINECELFNGGCSVSPYVECRNTPGSRTCGPCPPGYEGDGITCRFKGVCNMNNGGCHILATCESNPAISEFNVQCVCPPGYTGSGIGPTGCAATRSSAITSCSPNPCVHGTCLNNSTRGIICICDGRYTGTYCEKLSDPCASNPCLNGGTCIARSRRFVCTCMSGFTGKFCQKERQECGGNLNSPNGTIKYPANDYYSVSATNSVSCAWTIKIQEDKVIQVDFSQFNFADTSCTSQWFQVHDGRNSLAPGLGRFCGKTLPFNGSLTTTHNMIYFWLRALENSGRKPQFELSWTSKEPACGGTLLEEGVGIITSPGWPNNYPNNRNCFWHFSIPVNKRLLFHVYSLNIGFNSDCSGDYLEFYTKKAVNYDESELNLPAGDQVIAQLCNSTIPEPFYSLAPTGFIHFKSNEKDNFAGFQIGYSLVDAIPGCGGIYTTKDGYIQSIEMTSSMPNPLICAYEIKLPMNTTIDLEFLEVSLEENCDETHVGIYLQTPTFTSLILKYCGSNIPGPITTFGNDIIIRSKSKLGYKNHWKIKYKAICHQSYIKPSDTIFANLEWDECQYLIEQPAGKIIVLDLEVPGQKQHVTFTNFFVKIYDGDNENATLLGSYEKGVKVRVESNTNYLLIKSVNLHNFYSNFSATYTTVDIGCGGLLRNDLGNIAYPPHGEEKYSPNKKCKWIIMAPPGKVIQLTWMTFYLEQSLECTYDNVQVYDNNTDLGFGGLLGTFCGYTLPPVMLSSSNIMSIYFNSDTTIHGDGFLVSYTFIKETNVCGGNYFTPAGVIKSPGYPLKYPTNRECIWTITVPPGSQIMLKFTNFSLEAYSSCRYDWLEIRNGGTSSSPLIGKYCGTTHPNTIPSHTNKLFLKFNSDMSRTAAGFRIEWTSAATGCGGSLFSPSGSIMSPHYPEPYSKNTDCVWKISINAGSRIQIIFADIDLEKHNMCALDFVQLFDGPTMDSKSLGKFCVLQNAPVISSSNFMVVRFRSDVSFQGRGFNLQYSTICSNTMKGFSGVIESPNFPNDYPQDQNCAWEIIVNQGNKINISFSDFALERSSLLENNSCTFDYVEIEYVVRTEFVDTNDLEWRTYNRYCGYINPGLITLDSSQAKIHFVSDSLLLGSGFRLEWQSYGCGGILITPQGELHSPNYPKPYPSNIECVWQISVLLGQSIAITFLEINIEKDGTCTFDFLQIYNGIDDTYPLIGTYCHQQKPITITSSGNNMLVKFKSDFSYEGPGFIATYVSQPTNCGGDLSAPRGSLFSPNYPKNFNRNETCEWLIGTDENHVVELQFVDVDLIQNADCKKNYIKVYDGPSQAYPVLFKICGNTTAYNKTIRSTNEMLFVEFTSNTYLTSKGFKAEFKKACGAKIQTSSSGIIEFKRESFTESEEYVYGAQIQPLCTYTIEANDKSNHITLTITKLDLGVVWCDENTSALKVFNGYFNSSPLIGEYCTSKLPPPIVSDGSALHIEVFKQFDFSAAYSVLDTECGGVLSSAEGFFATPGWPKRYPQNYECTWIISMGPGNEITLNFIKFNIPESENCNTDFLEIRETGESGKLLGVFCGTNPPTNVSSIGNLYLIFKSSNLSQDTAMENRGFYADYSTANDNKLSGSKGYIGNQNYPNPQPSGSVGTYSWLITTNSSTIIELSFIDFIFENFRETQCYGNVMKIYDGMDSEAPLLQTLCHTAIHNSILSSSNMMYITVDLYSSRIDTKFLLSWKELPKRNKTIAPKGNQSECQYSYTLDGPWNVTLQSPGYPTGYAPNLNCEWIFRIPSQYHLIVRFMDINFGVWGLYRVCTYADVVRVYTQSDDTNKTWQLIKEICNNTKPHEEIKGSNVMKVEFKTNRFLNGTGFQALVVGACGGTLTEPTGIIDFYSEQDIYSDHECEWNINVRTGRTIKLTFEEFDLGPNDSSNCRNYLIIRNGKFFDSPFLGKGKYCEQEKPPDLESNSNHLYLKYTGWSKVKGFKIRYSEISIDCGQDIRLSREQTFVEITSPNYPNIPPPHTECLWKIRAPADKSLRIDFEERFDISQYTSCTTDYIELRDGGTDISKLIGRFCSEAPSTKFTQGNMLRIKYFTDSNEPRNGFKANISISYCGGTIRGEGSLNSKELHVDGSTPCTWLIKAPLDYYYIITIIELPINVADNKNCKDGKNITNIQIYETSSITGNSSPLGIFCSEVNVSSIQSTTNELKVIYQPTNNKELNLQFKMFKEKCGGVLEQETGTITSPSYPLMNHENRYCLWRIKTPKGRRISMFMEDLDIDFSYTYLLIFEGFNDGPKIVGQTNIESGKTYETSDNTAHILFWQETPSNKRGFKLTYKSDKPSICEGDLNSVSGVISTPQTSGPFRCEYEHKKHTNEETLAMKVFLEVNASQAVTNRVCSRSNTGIIISEPDTENRICQNPKIGYFIARSTFDTTTLIARRNSNDTLNFTISFETYPCGGILKSNNGSISSPNFPNALSESVQCSWIVELELIEARIKLNFTAFDLEENCDRNYLVIYNGQSQRHPKIGKYCKNDKLATIISQKNTILIEYKYEKSDNVVSKGFSLQYEAEIHGCGGLYQTMYMEIESPNYKKGYKNNEECLWDIRADEGNMVQLEFFDRFYIEESADCNKDYVEIFDWKVDGWVSLGKKCGRNLPQKVTSSNNQLRILFRTNQNITGTGFRARWTWQCGGVLEAVSSKRYLTSPDYSNTNLKRSELNCTYTIVSKKPQGIVSLYFLEFHLGSGSYSNCAYVNLTLNAISTNRGFSGSPQVYCGNNIPTTLRYKHGVVITYHTIGYFTRASEFKIVYKDESCGGNITKPASLKSPAFDDNQLPGIRRGIQPKMSCLWYITAPPDQIPVLSIHNLSMALGLRCTYQYLAVYDGLEAIPQKRLAQLCGKIEDSTPVPATSNNMLVKLDMFAYHFEGLQAEVYFTYGPSVGCGGTINLTDTTHITSPSISGDIVDCHWTIVAPRNYKVQLTFSEILISNVCGINRTQNSFYCACEYIEVRDGGGPFAEQMVKLCTSDNNSTRTLTTSWNTAYVRLFATIPKNYKVFQLVLKPIESPCGPSQLTATRELQEITSPYYPNSYPENIKCTWIIRVPGASGGFVIHFEDLSFVEGQSGRSCDSDQLQVMDDPNQHINYEGFGQNARHQIPVTYNRQRSHQYVFCENETKPFDYYAVGNEVILTFKSFPYTQKKGRGFKLKYGYLGCNRTIQANEGRIQNDGAHREEKSCITTITSDPNSTLTIYFMSFFFINQDQTCTKFGLEIREGNATGKQILKACGYRLPNPVFSDTNQLYIRSYNLQQRPGSYFKYNFIYVSSDKGKGCGGKLYNYMGTFSSPMYPYPYRKENICTWDVVVPKGLKVALKFKEFNIGGACAKNKVVVTIYNAEIATDYSYCPENVPAVLYSENVLKVTYYSSVNNGGNGWLASFQAVKDESEAVMWT